VSLKMDKIAKFRLQLLML